VALDYSLGPLPTPPADSLLEIAMPESLEESNADLGDPGEFRQDYHRRTMEEIRAAVTRGAAGLQASYFFDQEAAGLADEPG
jgi:hypothetical protein